MSQPLEIERERCKAEAAKDPIASADVSKIIEGLSSPMRVALTCSHRGRVWAPRMPTIEALVNRGLADDFEHTPEGLAVRDELFRRASGEELSTLGLNAKSVAREAVRLCPPGYAAGYAAFVHGEGTPPDKPDKRAQWDSGYASAQAHAEADGEPAGEPSL